MEQTICIFCTCDLGVARCQSQQQCRFWRMNSMFEAYCTDRWAWQLHIKCMFFMGLWTVAKMLRKCKYCVYLNLWILPILILSGMFFQWIYCSATMMTGVVVQLIRNCPPFHPIVMLGGITFATGKYCLPAKSDSDVMFCLQSYQGLVIRRIGLIYKWSIDSRKLKWSVHVSVLPNYCKQNIRHCHSWLAWQYMYCCQIMLLLLLLLLLFRMCSLTKRSTWDICTNSPFFIWSLP